MALYFFIHHVAHCVLLSEFFLFVFVFVVIFFSCLCNMERPLNTFTNHQQHKIQFILHRRWMALSNWKQTNEKKTYNNNKNRIVKTNVCLGVWWIWIVTYSCLTHCTPSNSSLSDPHSLHTWAKLKINQRVILNLNYSKHAYIRSYTEQLYRHIQNKVKEVTVAASAPLQSISR